MINEQTTTTQYWLRCRRCGKEYDSTLTALVCPNCTGSLEVFYDYPKLASEFSDSIPRIEDKNGVWRYSPILPITSKTKPITLGEGGTPLLPASAKLASGLRVANIYIKDESRNPTLSYKDRKSSVAMTKAAEFGAKAVANMTAGNAGSSVAAYAARAGIEAYIFTADGISESKLAKLVSYGAHVFRTKTTTKELMSFVEQVARRFGMLNLTAASRYNPYVKEGAKTVIFELFEQMDGSLPDWLIVPIGGGGNIASIYKGLRELKLLGLIDAYPRLIGVQGEGCAPVVEAFSRRLTPDDEFPVVPNPHTIAHSILDSWTPDGDQALVAINDTRGTAVGVSDAEILAAMKEMSAVEGIYVEPAGATALAALRQVSGGGMISRDESVAMIATGNGANQPAAAMEAWGMPPLIQMDIDAFERMLPTLHKP